MIACSEDLSQPTVPDPIIPRHSGEREVRAATFLVAAGCSPRIGIPHAGDIGLFEAAGHPTPFDCRGVPGASIRSAVARYRDAKSKGISMPAISDGYFIRHWVAEYRCSEWTQKGYLGDVLLGNEEYLDTTCRVVLHFWDEWVPFGSGDDLPIIYPGGGGPFFSPTDPLNRQPTIDTMPDDDHLCDSWAYDTARGTATINYKCLQRLDSDTALKRFIWDSIPTYFKQLNSIQDTLLRRECDSVQTWFTHILAYDDTNTAGKAIIWKGRTDMTMFPADSHLAQTSRDGNRMSPGYIHVDPKVYNKLHSTLGKRVLAEVLWHESIHAVGNQPTHASGAAAAAAGYPNDPYFRSVLGCLRP